MRLAVIEPSMTVEFIDTLIYTCSCGNIYRHPVARP
jgi:hypothetical protein